MIAARFFFWNFGTCFGLLWALCAAQAPCGARQALCAAFAGFRVVELQARSLSECYEKECESGGEPRQDLESDESANLETETSIFLLTRDLQTCAEEGKRQSEERESERM